MAWQISSSMGKQHIVRCILIKFQNSLDKEKILFPERKKKKKQKTGRRRRKKQPKGERYVSRVITVLGFQIKITIKRFLSKRMIIFSVGEYEK